LKGRLTNAGPIGLDISARGIRAVQLRKKGDTFALVAKAEVSISPSDSEDEERVFAILKDMFVGKVFAGRRVAVCVPDRALEIKNMRLPQMPEEELAQAALFEAQERFVTLRDGYSIRTIPAGLVGSDKSAQQELIVLAAAEEVVGNRLATLTKLGLTAARIEPTATALFRPYEQFLRRSSDGEASNVFVDIGEADARILISAGENIAFLKTCSIGGQRIDEALTKELVLSAHEATKLRVERLGSPSSQTESSENEGVVEAIKPVIEQLAKEVSLCLRYYSVTFRAERPDQVTIVGEAASPMVATLLSESLQVPVHVGKAFSACDCEGVFDERELATGLPQWTTALGLAMCEGHGEQRHKVAS